MCSQCKNSNLSAFLVLIVVFGFFFSGAVSAVLAAAPSKKECTQGDVYERLTCRQAALAEQMEYTSDTVFAEGTKLHQRIKPARLAHIKNSKEKAQRAKRKNTKEAFKRQAKAEAQNKKGGHLVPLDDVLDDENKDGICDYEQGDEDANCAPIEIELDENGDPIPCNPKKKNKGKGKGGGNPKFEGLECDRFFDSEEASTISEEEDMEEAAEQLEATYSATEDDLIEMNEHLTIVNENLPEGPAAVKTAANGCELPELTPGLAEAVSALRGVHAGLFGGARIATAWFGQDVIAFGFGGNARGAAATFDIAALAANIAYITLDEIHKSESGELQSAVMNCVNQTAGDIALLRDQISDLQDLIQQEHEYIIDLLKTPQGRRDEFPIQ